jgi:hypothetical protein
MRRKKKPVSFISERTAEYSLVPPLCAAFRKEFPWVLPLFYWATREGSAIAADVAPTRQVRVVTVYARRPKLESREAKTVRVRLNPLLFRAAMESQPYAIPVYAGVPRVASFDALATSPAFAWFRIHPGSVPEAPVDIGLDLGTDERPARTGNGVEALSLDSLIIDASKRCRLMTWTEAMAAIRSSRVVDDQGNLFGFGGYKPFHLLLSEEPV